MEALLQDLQYAVRTLIKNRGFTIVATLALALGIGANTAIFSVLNAVILRPLPFPEEDRLVIIWGSQPQIGHEEASLPDFLDWQAEAHQFESMAGLREVNFALSGDGEPERVRGSSVNANLLDVLGVRPALGRGLTAEDDRPGAEPVAILGDGLWRRRFGADPGIVGRNVQINGRSTQIIGVMPPGLPYPRAGDILTALSLKASDFGRRNDFLLVTARLAKGATMQSAQAEITGIAKRLEEKYPESNAGWTAELVGLRQQMAGRIRTPLLVLSGAVAFILLIACANVANLSLARATARSREIAIRTALGARRGRIVRQLVTESVLLALVGGGIGVLLAVWGVGLIQSLSPGDIPRFNEASVDARVLGFTALISILTGIVFGVVPAIEASRSDPQGALKDGARAGSSLARTRLRSAFAALEIGLATTLLVGAGLLIRTMVELNHVEPGFDAKNLLTARVGLPDATYSDDEKIGAFYDRVMEEAAVLPGVLGVAATSNVPLVGGNYLSFLIEGRPEPAPEVVQDAEVFTVSSKFFETLRIPVVQGRAFEAQDREGAAKVVTIGQTLARRYWPGEDPLGKRITLGDPKKAESWRTVVGVVGDVRNASLQDLPYPQIYLPQGQSQRLTMTLAIRSNGTPMALAPALRDVVRRLDPTLPMFAVQSMEDVVRDSTASSRFVTMLGTFFGTVALLLAAVGIYGVLAYSVGQRLPEFGIRMALGAQRRDILGLVLRHGLTLAIIGVGAGALGALAVTRALSGMLYGVTTTDPITFVAVAVVLTGTALLACAVPARRAMRVDPIVALRYE